MSEDERVSPEAMTEAWTYGEFVAPDRLGTTWWMQPTALPPEHESSPLTRWLAARIVDVGDEQVILHAADVRLPADPARRPERFFLDMPLSTLDAHCPDPVPALPIGAIVEIGIYGAGADAPVHIRVVARTGTHHHSEQDDSSELT